MGCNKIALGHHFNDVIETTLMGMLYGGQIQAMLPRRRSDNYDGMELIRPLYCVHEEDILAWRDANALHFLQCACRFTSRSQEDAAYSRRARVKALIAQLKSESPEVERSIFHSIHTVQLDSMPGYKSQGIAHSFLERLE